MLGMYRLRKGEIILSIRWPFRRANSILKCGFLYYKKDFRNEKFCVFRIILKLIWQSVPHEWFDVVIIQWMGWMAIKIQARECNCLSIISDTCGRQGWVYQVRSK